MTVSDPFAPAFTSGPIPTDDDPTIGPDAINPNDLTCIVCGVPLEYRGSGRKPTKCDEHKRQSSGGTGGGRKSATVELAVTNLDMMYAFLGMMVSPVSPSAGERLTSVRPSLAAQNRMFLEGDPELARWLTKSTAKGRRIGFVALQLSVVVPVVNMAADDFRLKREQWAMEKERAEAEAEHGPDWRPGL